MPSWTWAAAVCRGTSHERSGTPAEDAQSCFEHRGEKNTYFVGIASDGAGSAEFGGQGAVLVCRAIGVEARRHFQSGSGFPSDADITSWVDTARDWIFSAAERRAKMPRDFASTLVCAISTGTETVVAHIGDGCAVLKDGIGNEWIAPTWPDHGEYASTTTFVTDDPVPKLRLNRYDRPVSAIVLFTDGLERLALDFVARKPFSKFFNGVCAPLFANTKVGRDVDLSVQLAKFLNGPSVNERTDDDKTLILAVLK